MRIKQFLKSPEVKKQRAEEKRRRLSYLKGKHQEAYRPSEARAPRPKPPRPSTKQILKGALKGVAKANNALQKQVKNMPSDKQMDSLIWGNNEQKKKS